MVKYLLVFRKQVWFIFSFLVRKQLNWTLKTLLQFTLWWPFPTRSECSSLLSEGLDAELGSWVIQTNVILPYISRNFPSSKCFSLFLIAVTSVHWKYVHSFEPWRSMSQPLSSKQDTLHCYVRWLSIEIGSSIVYQRWGRSVFLLYIWRIKLIHSICFV